MNKHRLIIGFGVLVVLSTGFYIGTTYQSGKTFTDSDENGIHENSRDTVEPTEFNPKSETNLPEIDDTVPTITSFDACVNAGFPVLKTYPASCVTDSGETFKETTGTEPMESSDSTICSVEQKQAKACTKEYRPVCGLVEVQCITTPCNPVPQTFGNACSACAAQNVISYTEGECSLD